MDDRTTELAGTGHSDRQSLGCGKERFQVTETTDENADDQINPTEESLQSIPMEDDAADEFMNDPDDEFDGDFGEDSEELTPNDIFGLDPLDVLTLEEAAEYLKVSPAAVRRAIKEQSLPAKNLGGELRLLRDAVANWLRDQEPAVQQQQKARQDYSKQPSAYGSEQGSYSAQGAEAQAETEYRPRQRYSEGGQQEGGQQYGNRGGNQYGSRGGQYGGYRGYSQGQRRPFRSEGQGEESYGSESSGGYGYGGGRGNQYGGGYSGGGQRYGGGGPKRKNRRHVFENERGKRMDRRRDNESTGGQE